jgi:molybdate transport system permease protein
MRAEPLPLKNTIVARPKPVRWLNGAWQILALPMTLFFALPIVALYFRVSPADVIRNLNEPQVLQAVRLSVFTSLTTVLITVVFGTPVAYLLFRRKSTINRMIDILIDLPTVLPPAAAGVGLLMAFGRQGLLGSVFTAFGISIPFSTAAVILAQTFIASPLYIKSAALGFAAVDCELKKAAAMDGANRWQVFQHIMLPMSWMALLSGIVLTWARALGEFGATIIFAGNFPGRTQTMPLAIYLGFNIDIGAALTLSVIMIFVSFLILAIVKGILHRHLEDTLVTQDY